MTLPTDFASFASGWNLTTTDYSGGAAGTYPNLVSGQQVLQHEAGTPTFNTYGARNYQECASTQRNTFRWVYGQECTILVVARVTNIGAANYLCGTRTGLGWALATAGGSGNGITYYRAFSDNLSTATGVTINTPFVLTLSFSPEQYTTKIQLNSGATASKTQAGFLNSTPISPLTHLAVIGGIENGFEPVGAISRVLIFNRDLFVRDNTNLQSLITTEIAAL